MKPARFGVELGRAMTRKRVSFRELSRRSGLAPAYLNQLANGRRDPSDQALEKIAGALELDVDVFFEWRRRRALEQLERRPELVDRVYAAAKGQGR